MRLILTNCSLIVVLVVQISHFQKIDTTTVVSTFKTVSSSTSGLTTDSIKAVTNYVYQKVYLFELSAKEYNFNQSIAFCEQNGATLVKLRSVNETEFVGNLIPGHSFYMGVKVAPPDTSPTNYADSTRFNWTNWEFGQPTPSHNESNTVIVGSNVNRTWYVSDLSYGTKSVICERPLPGTNKFLKFEKAVSLTKTYDSSTNCPLVLI